MKSLISLYVIMLILSIPVFTTSCSSQTPYEKWQYLQKSDMRLLPKYEGVNKPQQYLYADKEFIEEATKQFGTKAKA